MEEAMTKSPGGRRTAAHDANPFEPPNETSPESEEGRQRRRFAKSLTRAVFGRYYWDDEMEEEKRRALLKRKSPKPKTGRTQLAGDGEDRRVTSPKAWRWGGR
jgi:hypothetical protein